LAEEVGHISCHDDETDDNEDFIIQEYATNRNASSMKRELPQGEADDSDDKAEAFEDAVEVLNQAEVKTRYGQPSQPPELYGECAMSVVQQKKKDPDGHPTKRERARSCVKKKEDVKKEDA